MSMKLNIIEVTQPIGKFYICKMRSQDIWKLAKADSIRIASNEDNLYKGVQRVLDLRKVNKIKRYLESKDSTFPNSIILNLNEQYLINMTDNIMEIEENENAFTIIDGQHRLEGLKACRKENFEVTLSIFIGLEIRNQSRIFVTINTEQTKVDPSLGLYQELNDDIYTPRKMIVRIAEMFNIDKDSPWKNMIKLVGKKDELSEDGLLSLKAFAMPILDLIYDDEQHNDIRNNIIESANNYDNIKKFLLWQFYEKMQEDILYKILFNYFTAVKDVFINEWGNNKSLLNKTTGYNAIMKLFKDLVEEGITNSDLSYAFFRKKLDPLRELEGKLNSDNYSTSGLAAAIEMYQSFLKFLN